MTPQPLRVGIVGGGLAGLAAAVALVSEGCQVQLFEARRSLGGRAGSFRDPETGEWLDHCQHVGMGCCTNLRDFFQRTGCLHLLRRYRTLHFFGPDGRRCDFVGRRFLPAPLHLTDSFWRMNYLSRHDRLHIGRTLRKLARLRPADEPDSPAIGSWLREQGASQAAIDYFWSVVLVSALGESIERASLAAARKVFVDGFLSHPEAYEIDIPTVSLETLYGQYIASWLSERGAVLRLESPVRRLSGDARQVTGVIGADEQTVAFDAVVLAVPWRRLGSLLPAGCDPQIHFPSLDQIQASPVTAAHLWFDRPVTDLPHAILVGRLSQWLFRRDAGEGGCYYQVVISASQDLAGRQQHVVIEEVLSDLAAIWPAVRNARLQRWRLVTQREAVFSVRPGFERLRPEQATAIRGLYLAGDWTRTGWPSTMEGAVRSGYLAAEAILHTAGRQRSIAVPDLPSGWLARQMIGR